MKRILLMVLYNLPFVPDWWFQLCYYSGHTDQIPEDKKYALLKKIKDHANRGGRVKIKVYGKEHIPQERGFMFFPNHQGLFDVLSIIEACDVPFSVVAKIEVKDILFLYENYPVCYGGSEGGQELSDFPGGDPFKKGKPSGRFQGRKF